MVKFLRRIWSRYSKLGKRRKKKQIWRRPTGRDNKMRERRRGYPAVVSIGYKKSKDARGKIEDKKQVVVNKIKDLERLNKNEIAIMGNVGKKKKIEIAKKAKDMKISIYNLNVEKFLKQNIKQKKENETK
ncbi:50S ribosomal protein L32e [Candidatus Pacearchaeota archaeon]|nr:50S ribosomal protein L32e [Candidatus Pacearchaeota archaeon]